MPNHESAHEFGFAAEPKPEVKLSSRFVTDAKGVPNDEAAISVLEDWAEAWGGYEIRARAGEAEDSAAMQALRRDLDEKTEALKRHLPHPQIHSGDISWEGGHVLLWIPKERKD